MRIELTNEERETISRVLHMDLDHARDAVARAEMQQKRMPFDHDNMATLGRYQGWLLKTQRALVAIFRDIS
jgi:hypothetical protein